MGLDKYSLLVKGRGKWKKNFFTKILLLRLVSVDFLANGFHYQTGACKIDLSPVLLGPARRIQLQLIWGAALRDIVKGAIAERTYIMYVERLPCLHRLES